MLVCDECRTEIAEDEAYNAIPIEGSSYSASVWLAIRNHVGDVLSPEQGQVFCQKCTAEKIIVMLQEFLAEDA